MTRKIRRLFAQLLSFRFCCPTCGELNTLIRTRSRASRFNRISGKVQCPNCKKSYYAGLLLWEVRHGGGKGGHPDQIPTPLELAQIREEVERDEISGRFVPVHKGRNELINRMIAEDRELEREID